MTYGTIPTVLSAFLGNKYMLFFFTAYMYLYLKNAGLHFGHFTIDFRSSEIKEWEKK